MIVNRTIGNYTWIDMSSPSEEEAESLVLTQGIDASIAKDLLYPTPKQQARELEEILYAVIHIPAFRHSHANESTQEIDCVIKKDSLVTARYDSIDALHLFAKQSEVDDILKNTKDTHPFFGLMREIYSSLFNELYYIEDWIKDIEKNIFLGKEKEMVVAISTVSRNLLNFERIVLPHRSIWQTILASSKEMFGKKFESEAQNLLEDWERLALFEKNLAEMITEIRETNNSLLTTKQNEIMKFFSILAFFTLPISFIAAIFGMNTKSIPIIGMPHDFWVVIGIMLTATLAMFTFFRYKKWI